MATIGEELGPEVTGLGTRWVDRGDLRDGPARSRYALNAARRRTTHKNDVVLIPGAAVLISRHACEYLRGAKLTIEFLELVSPFVEEGDRAPIRRPERLLHRI